MAVCARIGLAGILLAGVVPAAWAVCGDGVVDGVELCDDGNIDDGDCCTSTCGRPDTCTDAGKSSFLIFDGGDDREDKFRWKWLKWAMDHAELGDPRDTTAWSFCIWDDDELVMDAWTPPGGDCQGQPCWRLRGTDAEPAGYVYRNKQTNDAGIFKAALKPDPTRGFLKLQGKGINLALPGAVSASQYFNQTTAVTLQLVGSDAAACLQAVFPEASRNKVKLYKARFKD